MFWNCLCWFINKHPFRIVTYFVKGSIQALKTSNWNPNCPGLEKEDKMFIKCVQPNKYL